MTREEKFNAINERLGQDLEFSEPIAISVCIITNYMIELEEEGIINGTEFVEGLQVSRSELGQKVHAICDEFDWIPEDEEIDMYCEQMVEKQHVDSLKEILKKFRDTKSE